jgi:hypothetical protein
LITCIIYCPSKKIAQVESSNMLATHFTQILLSFTMLHQGTDLQY